MRKLLLCLLLFLLPHAAGAAVTISEIAWMGTAASANDEWIELHNDGSDPVSLEGWSVSDGDTLVIPLSGTIAAGAYALLERTDDGSAPGSAFSIYTGALANTGATLTLYRADAGIEDRVIGGENWADIGGDNVTKDTPQRTPSGWITAAPTPGAAADDAPPDDTADSEPKTDAIVKAKRSGDPMVVELKLPDTELSLAIDAPEIGYVGQPVSFASDASGIGAASLRSLQYAWNFGDLSTAQSADPEHVFDYPGEYAVTLYASYAHHEQAAQKDVTILPVALSLDRDAGGDLLIHNNDQYEVDVSGYRIEGVETKVFPPRSILLPRATIAISGMPGSVRLFDARHQLLAVYPAPVEAAGAAQAHPVTAAPVPAQTTVQSAASARENFSFTAVSPQESVLAATATPVLLPAATKTEQLAATARTATRSSWPYFVLVGLICAGIVGIFATAKRVR